MNWVFKNNGINLTSINSMVSSKNGNVFANSKGIIYKSDNNGSTWQILNNHPEFGSSNGLAVSPNGTIFDGQYGKGVFRSLDNGDNWESCGPSNYCYIGAIGVSPDCTVFAGADFLYLPSLPYLTVGMHQSFNNGINFNMTNNGLSAAPQFEAIAFNSFGHIFIVHLQKVYRSIDNGSNWIEKHNGLPVRVSGKLTIDSQDILYIEVNSNIYSSSDNGENWARIDNGSLSGQNINMFIDKYDRIYIGTANAGIFISTDSGVSWNQINSGLTNFNVRSITTNQDGYIYAGTDGSGVFRSGQPILYIEESAEIPIKIMLYQNFPNPFNSNTSIEFDLNKPGLTNVEIYDLTGRKIISLINNDLQKGHHKFSWNGKNSFDESIASGVYIYTLSTREFRQSKKLLYLK